jgi:cell division protein FtsW (lipid II flippase)
VLRRRPRRPVAWGQRRSDVKPRSRQQPLTSVVREAPSQPIDGTLLVVVVILVLAGIVVAYTTTFYRGPEHLQSHLVRVGLGVAALAFGMLVPHTWYGRRFRWVILAAALGLLVATLVFGKTTKGAERWIELPGIPFQIQPSEIAKFALPMWLAAWFWDLEEKRRQDLAFHNTLLWPGLVVFLFLGLTLAQKSIGTTFIMAVSALTIFLLAGVRLTYFVPATLLAAILLVGAVLFFPHGSTRLLAFLTGKPWQQLQAELAIGSGGVFGAGVGGGEHSRLFVPEVGTDFAVAALCEEFGLLGTFGVFALYSVWLWRGIRIGLQAREHFGKYLAPGIAVTIFVYAMVHIGVAAGVLPTTGQPLPFVSYGGTAMIANLFAAGVLLNVSRYNWRSNAVPGGSGRNGRAYPAGARAGF